MRGTKGAEMTKWATISTRMMTATVLIWTAGTATRAATVYVSKAGNDANDGLSWQTAKLTVQAGISASTSGDQVWVAAGTYVERIQLRNAVALYGGFSGSETD